MQVAAQQGSEVVALPPLSRVRRRTTAMVLLIAVLASTAQLNAHPAASITLVRASRLLDPRTGNVLAPAAVLVEGDRIKQTGSPSQIKAPGGAKIIDLGNATLLPGLIDSHTHLLVDPVL